MIPKYLPDTNFCINLLKHHQPEVRHRFDKSLGG